MNASALDQYFLANKEGWNKRTSIHKDSTFYDVAGFKSGNTSLNKIELDALGDVKGKSILHLQCHFGLDTLSWARMGAMVTGIDLSDQAIELAKQISNEVNIPAHFVCCNVYDLQQHIQGKFDIVFTSYGVVGWLPDLEKWASIINHFLKPGGTFFMAEFHPVVWMMDENFERIKYFYHNEVVIEEEMQGTYTDREASIHYKEYSWNHSLSEVINALINNELEIESFDEYPYSYYNCFKNLVRGRDGYYRVKGIENKMPMMYSIKAGKKC